jgi:hypothetical protein
MPHHRLAPPFDYPWPIPDETFTVLLQRESNWASLPTAQAYRLYHENHQHSGHQHRLLVQFLPGSQPMRIILGQGGTPHKDHLT